MGIHETEIRGVNTFLRSAFTLAALITSFVSPASVLAETGTVKTQSQLNTEVGTNCGQPTCLFPDNNTEAITPSILRQGFVDIVSTLFGRTGGNSISAAACGVKADNTTDDSAAWATCISQANAAGNTSIVAPIGTSLAPTLSATITAANIGIVCPGAPGDCILKGGANNMLTWNNGTGGGGLVNMGIDNSGAATNTSVVLAVASAFPVQFLNVVLSSGVGTFVSSTGASVYIRNMTGQVAAVANTPVIKAVGGSILLSDSSFYTVGVYPPPAGRNVINVSGNYDSIQLTNNFFQIFDIGLNSTTAAGIVGSNVWLLGNIWDSIKTSTVSFDVSATGILARIHLNDKWMSSTAGPTISFTGAGTVEHVQISASIPKAGTSAIIFSVAALDDLKIFGTIAVQLNFANAAGTADGINVLGGTNYKNVSITGNSIGSAAEGVSQPKNGCIFGGAIDHLTFSDNDCQGTVANYDGMVAGTTTIYAHTNVVQRGNVGLVNNAATFAANSQSALVIEKDDGTNALTISGSNSCATITSVPCIRSDGTQVVINPAAINGVVYLGLDHGTAVGLKAVTAPASPGAGILYIYEDSTDLRFHDKNASGTIGTTVVADTGASNNFLTAISTAGVISKTQPATTNLSDIGSFSLNTSGTIKTTNTTDASSLSAAAMITNGGLAVTKATLIGTTLVVNASSANIISQGTGTYPSQAIVGGTAKATAGTQGFVIVSDDAANQLQTTYQQVGSATAAQRRVKIEIIEQGVSFRNVSIAEDGGAAVVGCTNGAVITVGDVFSSCGQSSISGVTNLTNTTDASSTSAAGMVASGGVGIAKKLYVGTDLNAVGGNVVMGTATKTLVLKQGSNGTVGTFVCTSGGTITISNTNIAISDAIIISLNTVGGTISTPPATKAITAATSFQVLCATNDTSTYNYAIIKNAAWLLRRDLNPAANDNAPAFMRQVA